MYVNIVYYISLYCTESATHTAHNTRLFAVSNRILANDMPADGAFVPAKSQRSLDGTHIPLRRFCVFVVMIIAIFSQRNACTF